MMVFLIAIVAILFITIIIGIASNSSAQNEKIAKKPEFMDIDVPDPTIASPEKFLDFIEKTPTEYLWQVHQQLDDRGKLKDIVLASAINAKSVKNDFNKSKYLKIIKKIQSNNYIIDETEIPSDYKFCWSFKIAGAFISHRKEYIIFELNEGSELQMKPEPYNTYDKNAIAIFHNKQHIGYVPAIDCNVVRDEMRYKHILKVADIVYKDDFIDVLVYLYKSDEQHENPKYYLDNSTLMELQSRKIKSEFLRPKKDAEDINAFYKKKVVITGTFKNFPDRNDLALLLYESGADIDTAITERVSYMIAGEDAGWSKLEKAKLYDIIIFNEDQILKIFDLKK